MPQLSLAPGAALLKEVELGAGEAEALQTPDFLFDSQNYKKTFLSFDKMQSNVFIFCCYPPASLLDNRRRAGDQRNRTLNPSSIG